MSKNYDEASQQAWPSFVDILSSTVLVLCFALLVLVIVLSVTRITSSIKTESDDSSPSTFRVESDIVGEYRAEFQKLAIISNPSLVREMEVQSDQPSTEETEEPYYAPVDSLPTEEPQEVIEPGESTEQVLGDIPKTVDARSVEVLKELIVVQRDVIEQQRKVIEQKNEEISQTVREYQSLLALQTDAPEVEDIRQEIVPREDVARFSDVNQDGERLTGPSEVPQGRGLYVLNPPEYATAVVETQGVDGGFTVAFNDNAPFLTEDSHAEISEFIDQNLEQFQASGVILESKTTDFALSSAEGARIAVERLMIFRSMLIEKGISPNSVTLRTLNSDDLEGGDAEIQGQEDNYGWVSVKAKD